ncbi:hypothetical protein [Kribbella sp. NPDC023855]|uniref:hypothetical protein n=1 Tax=Kribbella sp. NPDC023855 TaxID=3154698 RepID=UPI0033D2FB2B
MSPLLSISLPATEIDPNSVRPGWVALLIVLALGAATFLLWRNMAKQLKRIDFDPDAGARDRAPSDVPPTTSPAGADAAEPKTTDKATDADRPVDHPTN